MRPFWISWQSSENFELHHPWWVSGYAANKTTGHYDVMIVCAAVLAENKEGAKKAVLDAFGSPPKDIEWRFVIEQNQGWSPFCDRFPRADWMKWPLTQ